MQSQLVCSGCRTILLYPIGSSNVCCAICNAVTTVPTPESSQLAHVNCGNCRTMLMFPNGSPSVRCAICQYITNTNMSNATVPTPVQRLNGTAATSVSSTSTVVVENPMSVDESGKLVSNVVVGITTDKK